MSGPLRFRASAERSDHVASRKSTRAKSFTAVKLLTTTRLRLSGSGRCLVRELHNFGRALLEWNNRSKAIRM